MPVIATITAATAIIETVGRAVSAVLPFLRGSTEHMSYEQAEPHAKKFSDAMSKRLIASYGMDSANRDIAERYRVRLLNFISSSGRWANTADTRNAVAVFTRSPGRETFLPPVGQFNYLASVLHWHALWILVNMDLSSDTEFRDSMNSDITRFTLFPAISEAGLNPAQLSDVEDVTAPKQAGLFSGNITAWVLAGLAVAFVFGIFKRRG